MLSGAVHDHHSLRIGAVILSLGEHDSYRQVVADLLDQGLASADICIVHNPIRAEDRPVEAPPGASVLRLPRNLGYAGGMNAGMRHQLDRGVGWVWLLTHDVHLRPGAIDAMRRAAASAHEFAALGPLLVLHDSEVVFSAGGQRTAGGHPFNEGNGMPLAAVRAPTSGVRPCTWLDGSTMMLRARALADVGLYDTSLFGYTEDAQLCLRLERAGWAVGVVLDAVAEQASGSLTRPGTASFLMTRNTLRYAREAGGSPFVAQQLARHGRELLYFAREVIIGPKRRIALIQILATVLGTVAFLAGRGGPPPAWLPGRGADLGRERRP
jgi:GT2 family glycosyltransferase